MYTHKLKMSLDCPFRPLLIRIMTLKKKEYIFIFTLKCIHTYMHISHLYLYTGDAAGVIFLATTYTHHDAQEQ